MKSVKDKSLTTKIQKKIINVNKYGYNKDDNARIVQLTAFFHILKKELGESCYTEIANAKNVCYIPFSFNLYETIAMAKYYRPLNWYVEVDEDNYVEIRPDEITISGNLDFINKVDAAFEDGARFTSDVDVFAFNFLNTGNEYMWNHFAEFQYKKAVKIGDSFIKNGSMRLYPDKEKEYFIYGLDDYYGTPKENIEYLTLRSNLQYDKVIIIDNKRKVLLAIGLNEIELEEMKEIIKK